MLKSPNELREFRNSHLISKEEYNNIHQWLRKNYGSATKCTSKKCKGISKNYQWALVKGKTYGKNIKNFKQLCKSCHSAYDITAETKRKLSLAFKGKKLTVEQFKWHWKPVIKMTMGGKVLDTYPSINEAAKKNNMLANGISTYLSGKISHSGGFKWAYYKKYENK